MQQAPPAGSTQKTNSEPSMNSEDATAANMLQYVIIAADVLIAIMALVILIASVHEMVTNKDAIQSGLWIFMFIPWVYGVGMISLLLYAATNMLRAKTIAQFRTPVKLSLALLSVSTVISIGFNSFIVAAALIVSVVAGISLLFITK